MNTFMQQLRQFARYVRDSHHNPRPAGIPVRNLNVYGDLVFNNLSGFLDRCFPVSHAVLGEKRWRMLQKRFLRTWPLETPWFRELPKEFLLFLSEQAPRARLPRWTVELAHYEWAELAVDVMECELPIYRADGDLMQEPVAVNPALIHSVYHWPVHRISPEFRPRKMEATGLAVFRTVADEVCFCQLTPATTRLLFLLEAQPRSGAQAIELLAEEIAYGDPRALYGFAAQALEDLRGQGILLGVLSK